MELLTRVINHISEIAQVPSFSSYEERLHPYVNGVFSNISNADPISVPGNNIIYHIPGSNEKTIALAAHFDKINHYGSNYPSKLPVKTTLEYIEGAMDNSVGMGVLLTVAELTEHMELPDLLFFFSEMEESKGLKEHPELLKNGGNGYNSGMGAKQIAKTCLEHNLVPDEIITVDTTPLFKGKPGIALYSKHWELNKLDPSEALMQQTSRIEKAFKSIYDGITLDNNTNDYLHYGEEFNTTGKFTVPSVALEPAIFPYHQKGERVFISDIKRVIRILESYLGQVAL